DDVKAASNANPLTWLMVTGKQGTLVSLFEFDSNISGLTWTSTYVDQKNTSATQCNGDTKNAYAESGPMAMGALPTTDPSLGGTSRLDTRRFMYFLGPNAQVSDAERLHEQFKNPLQVEVSKP